MANVPDELLSTLVFPPSPKKPTWNARCRSRFDTSSLPLCSFIFFFFSIFHFSYQYLNEAIAHSNAISWEYGDVIRHWEWPLWTRCLIFWLVEKLHFFLGGGRKILDSLLPSWHESNKELMALQTNVYVSTFGKICPLSLKAALGGEESGRVFFLSTGTKVEATHFVQYVESYLWRPFTCSALSGATYCAVKFKVLILPRMVSYGLASARLAVALLEQIRNSTFPRTASLSLSRLRKTTGDYILSFIFLFLFFFQIFFDVIFLYSLPLLVVISL